MRDQAFGPASGGEVVGEEEGVFLPGKSQPSDGGYLGGEELGRATRSRWAEVDGRGAGDFGTDVAGGAD